MKLQAICLPFILLFFGVVPACKTPEGGGPSPAQSLEAFLVSAAEGVGDPLLRAKGYAELQKLAPEALVLIDANNDHVVTLDEVKAAVATIVADPKMAATVLTVAFLMRKQK